MEMQRREEAGVFISLMQNRVKISTVAVQTVFSHAVSLEDKLIHIFGITCPFCSSGSDYKGWQKLVSSCQEFYGVDSVIVYVKPNTYRHTAFGWLPEKLTENCGWLPNIEGLVWWELT